MAFVHRPTFRLERALPLAAMQRALASAVARGGYEARWARSPQPGADRSVHSSNLLITVPVGERHFWSPWLSLDLSEAGPSATQLFGRFSPHPSVWTAFAFGYLGLGVVAFFSAVFGACQLLLDGPCWAFWGVGIAAAVMLAMVLSARGGQRLAAEQMQRLRALVEGAGETPEVSAPLEDVF